MLVGFVSKSLKSAEESVSQSDLEAFDIIHGEMKFQTPLFRHHFIIETSYSVRLLEKGQKDNLKDCNW